ncbi:MAG TPA: hypothetical protein VMM13_18755, partial [Euzebya sp.]|nr:hypothetical protein [Euzebya sp.]
TSTGQWARYDAISGELTVLTFEGDPPRRAPRVQGALAWWDEPERPWLVRLDTGRTRSLRDQMVEGGRVVAATPSGDHLLVAGDGDHVISTGDGAVRTLPPQSSVTLSTDGRRLASIAPATAGADVYLENIDGSARRLIATVPDDGLPVPLEDGRVLVLGTASRIIQTDGTLTDLPPVPGAARPVVAADGRRVMVLGEQGLVLVDPDAATADVLADSLGWSVYANGPRTVLWAVSEDPAQTGALVVDPATGAVERLLPDTPTGPFTAISEDGRTVLLAAGVGGVDQFILTADGEVWTARDATDAALHPEATAVAAAVANDVTRTLLVGAPDAVGSVAQAEVEIATGRHPVWLMTSD